MAQYQRPDAFVDDLLGETDEDKTPHKLKMFGTTASSFRNQLYETNYQSVS